MSDTIETRQTFERVTVVGPMSECQIKMMSLHDKGFRVIRSGPYTDAEMHPQVDVTRYKLVGEREVECMECGSDLFIPCSLSWGKKVCRLQMGHEGKCVLMQALEYKIT